MARRARVSEEAMQAKRSTRQEVATLGGGCFWCLEAVYERIEGVHSVVSGYAGGSKANPTYEEVCTGTTGHAEVVQVHFDPQRISYEQILELFWKAHDPTTLNRQGADVGSQYRSIILYQDERQRAAANSSMAEAASRFEDPIVTEIKPLKVFYEAEAYHQGYYDNNRSAGYCRVIIRPKLQKLALE
jgi:peptide-methionine (S)-S-oxide reductase